MSASATPISRGWLGRGLVTPLVVVGMLAMVAVPLPAPLLDLLFAFNISLSVVVLLMVIYTKRPLDFTVFPTVLLLATLLRLGLNVASTRVVLLHGHQGTDAAGHVIEAFGNFVVGGNYAVGLVAFAILVVINFVVVTKGAGRISEVTARFTLDAMPGKQMAIDADLNAGIITQEQALKRRAEIGQEADFYGAMDGSSKFVRGDAVAGILVLLINIIGGICIGMLQHGMPISQALQHFALLTIGDGLAAQIPALVLSTAAAMIVTRASTTQDVGEQILGQLFGSPKALSITGGIIGALGLLPGMPNLVFLVLASGFGAGAYLLTQRQRAAASKPPAADVPQAPSPEARELSWEDLAPLDMVGLEVGYRLIPLVDTAQGGQLMARIKGVRRKLSQDLGFLVPAVHIRDNLELAPTAYRISLMGIPIANGDIHPDRMLAISPGRVYGTVAGIATKDPSFGLEAIWVEHKDQEQAQTFGYTVVDPATVIATHLSQQLARHAYELLGHDEVQRMLDALAKTSPKVVESLVPKALPLATIVKVMQELLREGVPVRDTRSIAECLAEFAPRSQDPAMLTAAVRTALSRVIVQNINGLGTELPIITLHPTLEHLLLRSLQASGAAGPGIEPGLAERLRSSVAEAAAHQELVGQPAVLVVAPELRAMLSRWLRPGIPALTVLSYAEIPDDRQLKVAATLGRDEAAAA
jgi:flagellar biosynthesis protein FlhA